LRTQTSRCLIAAARASMSAGKSIRVLKNAVRRLVVVKRLGRVHRQDLVDAGLQSATAPAACDAAAAPQASGGIRVAPDAAQGASFGGILAPVGKAVTEAVLAKRGGRVVDALRELRMPKGTWYRIRRGVVESNGHAAPGATQSVLGHRTC